MPVFRFLYSQKQRIFDPPKLQCHRGFWVEGLPQNSLASLKKAYELGYKMSEFDVRITKDRNIILFHDDTIGDRRVSDMTLDEIKFIHHVDSLAAVLEWFSTTPVGDYFFNIEIKSKSKLDRSLERAVLSLILKFKVQDRVLISSFNPLSLFYFRKKAPSILRALLLTYDHEKGNSLILRSQMLNALAFPHLLHLHEKYWSKTTFKSLLKLNIPIVLWTCNDLVKVRQYFSQGVYGIISDSLKPDDVQ